MDKANNNKITWLLLVAAIASEVTATLMLKAALNNPILYIGVFGGYVASFAFLSQVLQKGMPLGVAYGIWGASGVAITAIFSAIIYGEPFTLVMALGLLLVIGGVLLVEFGSYAAQKKHIAGGNK